MFIMSIFCMVPTFNNNNNLNNSRTILNCFAISTVADRSIKCIVLIIVYLYYIVLQSTDIISEYFYPF